MPQLVRHWRAGLGEGLGEVQLEGRGDRLDSRLLCSER